MKILGEAKAQYNFSKVAWCNEKIKTIREIAIEKWDHVSAYILTYIETYTKYTEEEMLAEREKHMSRKIDFSKKPEFTLREPNPDISFGLFANVMAKN